MRPLIYYVACSLDGYIAQEDGSFDGFVWDDALVADFVASFATFGAVLMGRKTYEVGLREGKTNPYPMLEQYVYSQSMQASPDEQVTLISEGLTAHVAALKAQAGKPIWLCGGANLAAQLFAADLVDELILKVNPVLFGTGIPLFAGRINLTVLDLTDKKFYPSGIVMLHYHVKR